MDLSSKELQGCFGTCYDFVRTKKKRAIINFMREENMRVMVMDGQGGGIGKALVEVLHDKCSQIEIVAVGTNATATANMMKGGTVLGATGENAVVFNSKKVDAIVGPIGIVMANAMLGEITPKMAEAVSSSDARLYLIPMNRCHANVIGIENKKLSEYIVEAVERIMEEA